MAKSKAKAPAPKIIPPVLRKAPESVVPRVTTAPVQQPDVYSPNLALTLPKIAPVVTPQVSPLGGVAQILRAAQSAGTFVSGGLSAIAQGIGNLVPGLAESQTLMAQLNAANASLITSGLGLSPQKTALPSPAGYYIPGASHPTFFAGIQGYQPGVTRSPRGTSYPGYQPLGSGYQPGVTRSPRGTRFAPSEPSVTLGQTPAPWYEMPKPEDKPILTGYGGGNWSGEDGGGGGGGGGTTRGGGYGSGLINWRIGY